jgi:hypothetical protein
MPVSSLIRGEACLAPTRFQEIWGKLGAIFLEVEN